MKPTITIEPMNEASEAMFEAFWSTLTPGARSKHTHADAYHFCADEAAANECAQLVLAGTKRATCSMKHWYESGQERRPMVGDLSVITDWSGKPVCIIEITAMDERRYCDVEADFAMAEGENDRTLESWRRIHRDFFSAELKTLGKPFDERIMLVREWFKVVHRPKPPLHEEMTALRSALERAWSAETSTDPQGWADKPPSYGQCTVTALLVQAIWGGEIVRAPVCGRSHFWNVLPDGHHVDLTRDQFPVWCLTGPVEPRSRQYVEGTTRQDGATTAERYLKLLGAPSCAPYRVQING